MTVLILIDWQAAFDHPTHWGSARNNPAAEANALSLLAAWRGAGRQVVHVVHDSADPASILRLDMPGGAPKAGFEPRAGEAVRSKRVNAAFIGTDLDAMLRRAGAAHLTICGLTTDHCVSTTARMAGNLGYRSPLAGDAWAAFARTGPDGVTHDAATIHATALASLHGEFATVRATEDILETAT